MNRTEFIDKMRAALTGNVNHNKIEENIRFYHDYIDTEVKKGCDEQDVVLGMGHHGKIEFLFQIERTHQLFAEMFSETAVKITPLDLVVKAKCVALYSRLIHLRGGAERFLDEGNLIEIVMFNFGREGG